MNQPLDYSTEELLAAYAFKRWHELEGIGLPDYMKPKGNEFLAKAWQVRCQTLKSPNASLYLFL